MMQVVQDKLKWKIANLLNALIDRFELGDLVAQRLVKIQLQRFSTSRQMMATLESFHYAEQHMTGAKVFTDKASVIKEAFQHVQREGLFLEFGVFSGQSINLIASLTNVTVHGFDSFQGLPEDWSADYQKGAFDRSGHLPKVRQNVELHAGWFDQTLPPFAQQYTDDVAFLHVDCDLYSSTKTIFSCLGDRIKPGCVIVFDEYFNYPGWREHEFKAFQELVAAKGLQYDYLCYNENEYNVAVLIR